jgi:hypothetical protein
MPGQTFTGQTLVEALRSGELDQPAGVVLIGMVKESEQPDHVAFARGGCDTWIDLPTSLIEQAEHAGARPCDDHSHPVFRITLRESDDPQAKLLAQLLATQPQLRPQPPGPGRAGLRPPRSRGGGVSRMAAEHGFHDYCMYFCDFLVRECIGFGNDWETCINLRVGCSDICGILSDVFGTILD